jgi:hypothetical protein
MTLTSLRNLVFFVLAMSACSSGSGVSAEVDALVASWTDEIVRDLKADGAVYDVNAPRCLAGETVDGLGPRLAANYLAIDEQVEGDRNEEPAYSRPDATVIAEATASCFDMSTMFWESLRTLGVEEPVADCLTEGYARAGWVDVQILSLTGDVAGAEALIGLDSLVEECGFDVDE